MGLYPMVTAHPIVVDYSRFVVFLRMLLTRSRTNNPGSESNTGGERRLLPPPWFLTGFHTPGSLSSVPFLTFWHLRTVLFRTILLKVAHSGGQEPRVWPNSETGEERPALRALRLPFLVNLS